MVKLLGRPISDHTPCNVIIETNIPKSKLFRFESFYIAHPEFVDVIKDAWSGPIRHGKYMNAAALLCQKLKLARQALTTWSKKISRLSIAIQNTNAAILKTDTLEERRALYVLEANYTKNLKPHLIRLIQFQK